METLEEWLSWFDDAELARYPELAVYGAWIRALTGRPADAERWLSLADGSTSTIPLSDRQRHDRAKGRDSAGAHDAGRCRASACRGRSCTGAAARRVPRSVPAALLARGVAEVLLGTNDRAVESLSETVERALAAGSIEEGYLAQAELALLAARREPGTRQGDAHGLHKESSTRRASATTRLARSCTSRWHESRSTRGDRRTFARRWRVPIACGRCSTTAFPG